MKKYIDVSKETVMSQAIHDCMAEMYAKSQPPADWDQLIEDIRTGKIGRDEKIYERHYLSQEEFLYILDKYSEAYRFETHWASDVEVVEEYLKNGGLRDKVYGPVYDSSGKLKTPACRRTEKVPPIFDQILEFLSKTDEQDIAIEKSEKIKDLIFNTIAGCKDFFKFDVDSSKFRFAITLGASPTSNPEIVKEYWKNKTGEDIKIEFHNPILFWYLDKGYTDDDLEEEFGPNWKEEVERLYKESLKENGKKTN